MKRSIAFGLIAGLATLLSTAQATTTPTPTEVEGILTFTGNVYARDAVPSGDVIWCELTITATETEGTNTETMFVQATFVSGQHYQCVAVIHYLWNLLTPTDDIVGMTWATGFGPPTLTSGSGAEFQFVRIGTHTGQLINGVPSGAWSATAEDVL